jgi:hypothetical protein
MPFRKNALGPLVLIIVLALQFGPPLARAESSDCCKLVQQALEETGRLKSGMHRKDVESKFEVDGGLSFNTETIYVYKACHYLQIKVKFSPAESQKFSPDDTIQSVSDIFVQYEVRD